VSTRALVLALACALLTCACGASSGLRIENSGRTVAVTKPVKTLDHVRGLDAVAFASDTHGWAAGTHAIIATTDAGRTWTQQYRGPADVRSLDFTDEHDGWAVAADTLLRTTDGGATWSPAGEPSGLLLVSIDFVSGTRGWGVAQAGVGSAPNPTGTVVQTTDGGESWSTLGPRAVDSICAAGGRTLFAGAGSRVLRSTDDGANWTTLFDATTSRHTWMEPTVQCAGRSSIWVLFLSDSAAGSQGYAAYTSSDSGASWRPVVVAPLLAGADPAFRGVVRLDAYPGPFDAVSANDAVFLGQCPACDPQHVMMLRTRDGGASWLRHVINGFVPTGLAFADAQHGWMTTRLSGYPERLSAILATTDGGRSWHPVFPA
jgi:photosystem II stability/assembly factor-like uncharacterized protein